MAVSFHRRESGDLGLELKNESLELGGEGADAAMVVCLWVETTIFQCLGRLWKPCATETLWRVESVGLDLQEFDRGSKQSLTWTCRSSKEGANSH